MFKQNVSNGWNSFTSFGYLMKNNEKKKLSLEIHSDLSHKSNRKIQLYAFVIEKTNKKKSPELIFWCKYSSTMGILTILDFTSSFYVNFIPLFNVNFDDKFDILWMVCVANSAPKFELFRFSFRTILLRYNHRNIHIFFISAIYIMFLLIHYRHWCHMASPEFSCAVIYNVYYTFWYTMKSYGIRLSMHEHFSENFRIQKQWSKIRSCAKFHREIRKKFTDR